MLGRPEDGDQQARHGFGLTDAEIAAANDPDGPVMRERAEVMARALAGGGQLADWHRRVARVSIMLRPWELRRTADDLVRQRVDEHLARLSTYSELKLGQVRRLDDATLVLRRLNGGLAEWPSVWQSAHDAAGLFAARAVEASMDPAQLGDVMARARHSARTAVESITRTSPLLGLVASPESVYQTIVGFSVLALMFACVVDDQLNPYEPLARLADDGVFLLCVQDDLSCAVWRLP